MLSLSSTKLGQGVCLYAYANKHWEGKALAWVRASFVIIPISSGKGASLPTEQLLATSSHQNMKILTVHWLLYSLGSLHAHFQSLPTGWHAGLPHLAIPGRQLWSRTKPLPTPPRRVTRWHLTTRWQELLVQWFQWLGLGKAPLFCPAPKGPNQSEL